ncbi:MAG: hypothetical protein WCJ35_18455 [Planctomycetota bacterium]
MTMKIKFNNPALDRQLKNARGPGLDAAADFLSTELQKVVSVPNLLRTPRGGYQNMHNAMAGIPPFTRTTEGMKSIRRTSRGRVSMLAYMAYLEKGTRTIRPRLWFYVTIRRLTNQLMKLVFGP